MNWAPLVARLLGGDGYRYLHLKRRPSHNELVLAIRNGARCIYEGAFPEDISYTLLLFYLRLRSETALYTDLVLILRALFHSESHLKLKDPELAITAIFEGWSNALLWGTLEMPPKPGRDFPPGFEKLLLLRLRDLRYSQRFVNLSLVEQKGHLVVKIQDSGINRHFEWSEACASSHETYRGLSIIQNCCHSVSFDSPTKTLHMTFSKG